MTIQDSKNPNDNAMGKDKGSFSSTEKNPDNKTQPKVQNPPAKDPIK